ncbi:MAG: D-glycero-alpha-D-manno-heptose-1,7-bisphosphate 7-phosphatase [Ignavibacteria bacterium]
MKLNKAIFLDRDGTLNEEIGFVTSVNEVSFFPTSLKALAEFKKQGFLNIIITNQSAVARGYITENELQKLHRKFKEAIRLQTGQDLIDDIFYCPYLENAPLIKYSRSNSFLRKPNPGMIIQASLIHKVRISKSFFIGDSYRDMKSADIAGCKKILVLTGYGQQELQKCKSENLKLNFVARNIGEAAEFIKKCLDY